MLGGQAGAALSRRAQLERDRDQMLEEFRETPEAFHKAYSMALRALQDVGLDVEKLNDKLGVEDASLLELKRLKLGTKPPTEVRRAPRSA